LISNSGEYITKCIQYNLIWLYSFLPPDNKEEIMKTNTYIDTNGNIVATGTISIQQIDLVLSNGTRFFSTRSDNYTLDVLKNLNISKIVKGLK
jgi:hypothetical protein